MSPPLSKLPAACPVMDFMDSNAK
ncbi:hypothetical protein CCACVL1_02670 [Corchorus capsularis]|uniref:Uncharacterized protein n=1 Tax=Corchorus capsularis TaxID=210143 RepID=A0A1R3K715_COCAP|nr:hypothetical protein CCACVL1_02670 [Corchorus capsularis]